MKKQSNLSRLLEIAGSHKYLIYASWVLSAISAMIALVPFYYIWKMIREVLEVAPNFGQAQNLTGNGWMAVLFAVIAVLVYIAGLMCSHLGAFRIATNLRIQTMEHIVRLPLGFAESFGSGKLRKIVNESSAATETYLAHQLPDRTNAIATPCGLLVLLFVFDWRLGLLSLVPVVLGFLIMMTMTGKQMQEKIQKQREFFRGGKPITLSFRKEALKRLGRTIRAHEEEIYEALRKDLNKSKTEAYMCEIGMTLAELSYMLKHIDGWARKRNVLSPIAQFSSDSFTIREPYGVVLIMSPWNYPFMLTIEPLIGAIAAGNCCVVKPSAYAPATSAVICKILRECFPEEYVLAVEGGRVENQALLDQRFDYIFFTGSVTVGKEVMAKAAKHLTPVTLELGGKSPCVVEKSAKLNLTAKRIAFGKLLNCGQTCVAPDYILVERSVKDEFLGYLKKWIVKMYGENATENGDYVKIINQKHFDRVCGLIDQKKVVFGGKWNEETMQIQPTIMDNVVAGDAIIFPSL